MALKKAITKSGGLSLPASLVSRSDVRRLAQEVEILDNQIIQHARVSNDKPGLPRLSRILEDIVEVNKLDFNKAADRQKLQQFLLEIKKTAPSLHMSFATEPSALFTGKLVSWLRNEINPLLLLDIGLQPSIAAGCIIRTTNKIIDCSMRQHLLANRPELLRRLRDVQHA